MQKTLMPAERLIVAADFKLQDHQRHLSGWVKRSIWEQVLDLANSLEGTGVCIKVNSALRVCGYELIDDIHTCGLRVFADLKLIDISETLSTDGVLLREARPELLTVVCATGITAMQALKDELPDTEVLGVTVLTSITNMESETMFSCGIERAVYNFAMLAKQAETDGLVCSSMEAEMLRPIIGDSMTINTPAIRPAWAIVPGDDQNPERIMTPAKAIKAGADRIVVGRPIVNAKNPYDAVMRTIEEIDSVTT